MDNYSYRWGLGWFIRGSKLVLNFSGLKLVFFLFSWISDQREIGFMPWWFKWVRNIEYNLFANVMCVRCFQWIPWVRQMFLELAKVSIVINIHFFKSHPLNYRWINRWACLLSDAHLFRYVVSIATSRGFLLSFSGFKPHFTIFEIWGPMVAILKGFFW